VGCGAGCICTGGKRTETICSNDGVDDDADGSANCADSDCAGKLCRTQISFPVTVSRDLGREPGGVGSLEPVESEIDPELITLARRRTSSRWGVLEFHNFPSDTAIHVKKAELVIYVEAGGIPVEARRDFSTPLAQATGTDAGERRFDVTALVKEWVLNTAAKEITLHYMGESTGTLAVRSANYTGITGKPRLDVQYESVCNLQLKCPTLNNSL
jgi:hypothetical protein